MLKSDFSSLRRAYELRYSASSGTITKDRGLVEIGGVCPVCRRRAFFLDLITEDFRCNWCRCHNLGERHKLFRALDLRSLAAKASEEVRRMEGEEDPPWEEEPTESPVVSEPPKTPKNAKLKSRFFTP